MFLRIQFDLLGCACQMDAAALRRRTRKSILLLVVLLSFITIAPTPGKAQAPQTTSRTVISKLIRQNRLDDAEQQLWGVLARQPDQVWALDLMAEIRVHQKRASEAEALFHKVLTIDPKDVPAHRGLGDLYRSLGKSTEAIESHSQVIAIAPSDMASNSALAALYEEAGKYKESLAAAERIPAASRPPDLLPILAADYFGTDEPAKVPPLILSMMRRAGAVPKVLHDFVTVLILHGYVDDAAHLVDAVKP